MVLVLEGLNLWPSSVVQKLFLEMQNLVKEDVPVVVVTGMTSLQALIDKLDFKTKRLIFAQDFRLAPANTVSPFNLRFFQWILLKCLALGQDY